MVRIEGEATPSARDRFRGALLGLAVGDAVGTTVEFKAPGTFAPITDMVGGGPFGVPAGAWTDDTSMALCWPRAWSSAAASIPSTSSSATSGGTAKGTPRARAAASTSATPRARRWSVSSARASPIPATTTPTRPAMGR
jgi:ADP-ribosylglycohydrolase